MIEQFNAKKPSRGYEPEEQLDACNKDLWLRAMIKQFNAKNTKSSVRARRAT